MDAARQAWLAQRHEAQAIFDRLPTAEELSVLRPGDVLALALPEDISEETVKEALGDGWAITDHAPAPETHDRFIRAVKRKVKAK